MPSIPVSLDWAIPDSSYLREWGQLPSPGEVRANAKAQYLAGDTLSSRNTFVIDQKGPQGRPPPAVFRDKNLFVKWGAGVRISEAHTLLAIGQFDDIPVPQVFGWCVDGGETFIYMEYLQGQTLEQAWDSMDGNHRISICHELRKIVDALRQMKQDHLNPFVGKYNYYEAGSEYVKSVGNSTGLLPSDLTIFRTFVCASSILLYVLVNLKSLLFTPTPPSMLYHLY